MRRAPIVITSTVAGLVGVLGFHPHSQGSLLTAAANPSTGSQSGNSAGTSSGSSGSGPVSVEGPVIPNPYGAVQVRVTEDSGRITAVDTVQIPQSNSTSLQINIRAEPQLKQEALAAQSAQIDGVSGASYTSAGYQQSLQAAIDKLPAPSTAS